MPKFWVEFDTDASEEQMETLASEIFRILQHEDYLVKNLILNGQTYKSI
jgi:hypothetical protein